MDNGNISTDRSKAVTLWNIHIISVLLCFRARVFIDALWSPAGKGLISWLSFGMSNNCEIATFPLVSWVIHVSGVQGAG